MQAVTVHGLFPTAGGADDFYFIGEEGPLSDFVVGEIQFTLIYFPTAYGTVALTPEASSGEIISYQSAENGLETPESGSRPIQAQVVAPAAFQQVQAQVMAGMEARIQKLEEHLRQIQTRIEEKR